MNEKIAEEFYKEHLEEDIIFYFASLLNISDSEALRIYYSSKLCDYIHEGNYGIQYPDYRALATYLKEEYNQKKGGM